MPTRSPLSGLAIRNPTKGNGSRSGRFGAPAEDVVHDNQPPLFAPLPNTPSGQASLRVLCC